MEKYFPYENLKLSYSCKSKNNSIVKVVETKDRLPRIEAVGVGTTTITVTATDNNGSVQKKDIKVKVEKNVGDAIVDVIVSPFSLWSSVFNK